MFCVISFLYVCMVNTIYLLSFVETPRKFIIAIINLRGVSTKLNKYMFCVALKLRTVNFLILYSIVHSFLISL